MSQRGYIDDYDNDPSNSYIEDGYDLNIKPNGAETQRMEPQRVGKYVIDYYLGQGAFGDTYKAYDPITEQTVAIKKLRIPPNKMDLKVSFENEIKGLKAVSSICQDYAVCIEDMFNDGETYYIIMEYIDGFNLSNNFNLQTKDLEPIIMYLIDGLRQIHRTGVAHQDIKPANIMYDKIRNRPRYIDWGTYCARILCNMEHCEQPCGTYTDYYYYPPELRKDRKKAISFDEARNHDIWSLGLTILQLYNYGAKSIDPLRQNYQDQVDQELRLVEMPRNIKELVKLMLVVDPQQRLKGWDDYFSGKKTNVATMKSGRNYRELLQAKEKCMKTSPKKLAKLAKNYNLPSSTEKDDLVWLMVLESKILN